MRMLTEEQAYAAVFYFLEQFWSRAETMQVADVLSGMSLLADGTPADPDMTKDWRNAVDYALNGGKAGRLELG